ncbi:MAG: hypothetical protein JWQ76_3918 [Ramlibacter sp.]|nr:hypothetical protein [Ramlibacter sp.]
MLWDIFCKVIDNHGDIGVCWRLSVQLAARGQQVRLWVDDASALRWMAPEGNPGVQVLPWDSQSRPPEPGAVVIEAFGCELATPFQAAIAAKARADGRQPAWINLEYLTAEPFAERSHGLPSPVTHGPAAGLAKRFFYPGFTARTGGLLREQGLLQRQALFDRNAWLQAHGIDPQGARLACPFCYEPPALGSLLAELARGPGSTRLLVTAGRATDAVRAALEKNARSNTGWNQQSLLSLSFLPLLTQMEFDHLLWCCDLNFVRGEDSLVRAMWAGKPLVWQIYPQHDNAHHAKLEAFLNWLDAPASLRDFHRSWNGISGRLRNPDPEAWAGCVQRGRELLLAREDLTTKLMQFAAAQSSPS